MTPGVSRHSNISYCCAYAWNLWHRWVCTSIIPSMVPGIYYYLLTHIWILIVNIALVNDGVDKDSFHVSSPCLCFNASLAFIYSYTIYDCCGVLYQPLKFVPWVQVHLGFGLGGIDMLVLRKLSAINAELNELLYFFYFFDRPILLTFLVYNSYVIYIHIYAFQFFEKSEWPLRSCLQTTNVFVFVFTWKGISYTRLEM